MKCDVTKCKGACCYNVPLEKAYINAYRKRIARPILRTVDNNDGYVLPITNEDASKNACPFLNEHYRCNIYKVRPSVCRLYGEGEGFLNCEFLTGIKLDTEKIVNGVLRLQAANPAMFNYIMSLCPTT